MPGPWEQYAPQQQAQTGKPWEQYASGPNQNAGPAPQQEERGAVSPFFKKSDGSYGWAVPAIITDLVDAVKLPGDVYQGNIDPMSNEGMDRAMTLGAVATGISPVTRMAQPAASASTRLLSRAMRDDKINPGEINAMARQMGPDATIADMGPNLASQAGALASVPGRSQSVVRDAMQSRAARAGERVTADVAATIGRGGDVGAMASDIISRQKLAAEAAYSPIRAVPIEMNGTISGILQTPLGKQAFRKAATMAANDGIKTGEGMTLGLADYAKRALDDIAQSARRRGEANVARQAGNMSKALRGAVDAQVPAYKQAREAFAGDAAILDALETGGGVFSNRMSPAQLRQTMNGMTASERDALLEGARAQIADMMGTARNDALSVRQMLAKGYNREKLVELIGKEDADKLVQAIEREIRFGQTQNAVVGNSETARRTAAQAEVNPKRSDVRQSTITGLIMQAFNSARGKLSGFRQNAVNEDLAKLLMGNQLPGDTVMQLNSLARPRLPNATPNADLLMITEKSREEARRSQALPPR